MPVNRRDFLSASAGLALAPVLGGRALAAPLPREADIVVSAAAARPTHRHSMCRSTVARAGCTIPKPTR
jgi:hypothetical protein